MPIRRRSTEFDSETGAVISQKEYEISKKSLILNTGKKRFLKKMYKKNPDFSKVSYLGYWYLLLDYLEMNTNRLVSRIKSDNWLEFQPLSNEYLMEMLDISKASFYRFIKEALDHGYMRKSSIKGGVSSYYINPIFALNGEGVSAELYLIFEGVESFESSLSKRDKEIIKNYLGVNNESRN